MSPLNSSAAFYCIDVFGGDPYPIKPNVLPVKQKNHTYFTAVPYVCHPTYFETQSAQNHLLFKSGEIWRRSNASL